nr:GspE/PulE family protein [uncultured Dyadobacter sp.]
MMEADIFQVITPHQAWHYRIVPKSQSADFIEFYAEEAGAQTDLVTELEMLLGKKVILSPIPPEVIGRELNSHYRREQTGKTEEFPSASQGDDFLTVMIREAKGLGSSDIHIESYEERCRIRLRIDGLMVERFVIGKPDYPSLINKIKIMANLDIAEKRLPQDGRIFLSGVASGKLDIRVSILPTLHGEKVVLRLLSNDTGHLDLNNLGFSEFDLANYLEGVKRPNGIMLISGPTGSGKTTTLYATLKLLNQKTRNVLTIEDPIEYTLEGVNQVQLKESIGLHFGSALRTFLRQDPDVIMVGEIRDPDTANMAIRAALTGHLVLSTIHTNSAWGTIARLTDMGVPAFLVASTLNTSVAQRLLRKLCPHCKAREKFNPGLYPRQFRPFRDVHFHYVATGCDLCFFTGYKGRQAVYEVVPLDVELSDCIKRGLYDVKAQLTERGVRTLSENAFDLFAEGETSLEEIYPLLFNL